jgi:hypothetical protein
MSRLQKKPPAHKRGYPTLQIMIFFYFCGSFLPSWIRIRVQITDPDPDPMVRLNTDPIRIRIRNPGPKKDKNAKRACRPKKDKNAKKFSVMRFDEVRSKNTN